MLISELRTDVVVVVVKYNSGQRAWRVMLENRTRRLMNRDLKVRRRSGTKKREERHHSDVIKLWTASPFNNALSELEKFSTSLKRWLGKIYYGAQISLQWEQKGKKKSQKNGFFFLFFTLRLTFLKYFIIISSAYKEKEEKKAIISIFLKWIQKRCQDVIF